MDIRSPGSAACWPFAAFCVCWDVVVLVWSVLRHSRVLGHSGYCATFALRCKDKARPTRPKNFMTDAISRILFQHTPMRPFLVRNPRNHFHLQCPAPAAESLSISKSGIPTRGQQLACHLLGGFLRNGFPFRPLEVGRRNSRLQRSTKRRVILWHQKLTSKWSKPTSSPFKSLTRNKKLLVTSASLLVTSALLLVTRSY